MAFGTRIVYMQMNQIEVRIMNSTTLYKKFLMLGRVVGNLNWKHRVGKMMNWIK